MTTTTHDLTVRYGNVDRDYAGGLPPLLQRTTVRSGWSTS